MHDFSNGFRLMYDYGSIRDIVNLCGQYGKIEVYVDSSLTDEELVGENQMGDQARDEGGND